MRGMEINKEAVINSISSRSRAILGFFLIICLPLLVIAMANYHNYSSSLFPSWLKAKETLPGGKHHRNQTTQEIVNASGEAAHNQSIFDAPTSTKTIGFQNETIPETLSSSGGAARGDNIIAESTNTSTGNYSYGSSRNDSSPSTIQFSSNQTLANSTNTSTLERPNHSLPISTHNSPPFKKISTHNSPASTTSTAYSNTNDKLVGGLLPVGFDEQSCLSRYEAYLYRKPSQHKPSALLISKLRSYEHLHKRCGPKSRQYSRTIRRLTRTKQTSDSSACKYIVWLPANGLGNRMVSLAATFLYALLTDRVLLVAFESDMSGLFCEPFPHSTWRLPHGFPHSHQIGNLPTYESMVKNIMGGHNTTTSANIMKDVPPFLFIHLQHQREEHDRFFHCNQGQEMLKRVPVLFLRSDQYFVPSLFMIPSIQDEINRMFLEKDSVFYHVGRYLFSPSNEVWRMITWFYKKNLSKADQKVGIQVRVFAAHLTPAWTVMEQILACTLKNNILPKVDDSKGKSWPMKKNVSSMAVLVASLYKDYSENLTAMYSKRATKTGEAVKVYQPSNEEVQKHNDNEHSVKALTDIYLLSLCDVLVTSGESTFGYVAQGLGGLKPWVLRKTVGTKFRNPPCERAMSMEPCFHFPPTHNCETMIKVDHISSIFPHLKRCVDIRSGVKMVSED